MKNLFITLLTITFFSTCGQSTELDFNPDVSILNIKLLDTTNIKSTFGKDIMSDLKNDVFPSAFFTNKNKDEVLQIVFHPGSFKCEFSEFKISEFNNQDVSKIIDVDSFVTESGISLGKKICDIVKIKGKPNRKIVEGDVVTFEYIIDDYTNSNFLKEYNLPLYYAKYQFKEDILFKLEFGFEYP